MRHPAMPRHDAGAQALIRRAAAIGAVEPIVAADAAGAACAVDSVPAASAIDAVDAGVGPMRIDWVDETGSTNADLIAWVRGCGEAAVTPRLLAAHRQTAGRGRRGKVWHGARGASLTFSLAWPLARADASGLSLAVGVALADALAPNEPVGSAGNRESAGESRNGSDRVTCSKPRIGLKWPNDLWLTDAALGNGRKLGGVLIEMLPRPARHGAGHVAVIGVGINIGSQPVPDAATGVAWLREVDAEATPERTLDVLAPALLHALRLFEQQGFAAFAASFAARDLLRDRAVRCLPGPADALCGTAVGVSPAGELLVNTAPGRLSRIGGGEVSIRLAESDDAAQPATTTSGRTC